MAFLSWFAKLKKDFKVKALSKRYARQLDELFVFGRAGHTR